VRPFGAVRYDERRAGRLDTLVAPPYDVLSPEERALYLARSPYNVVHLTLPDEEAEAARLWADWQASGILARDEEPALWWLEQAYVGPDGVRRTRGGLVCALHLEPYSAGIVLPHERTHAGPKEGRLRLLRALRAHVEPIFLLFDGSLDGPGGEPLVEVSLDGVRNRLWRVDGGLPAALDDARLLIADGHHRYETALSFHEEEGTDASAWLLAVIVPTDQKGLTIFPTHRIAQRLPRTGPHSTGEISGGPAAALRELARLPRDRSAVALYLGDSTWVVRGEPGELDGALVERLRPEGISYTPRAEEAVAAVDSGQAEAALLLRPPTLEQVREVSGRGETMPQKSTYFFPKLPSGMLFMPLDPLAGLASRPAEPASGDA
jgi:uncharacterized protein (DUF1015 family)